MKSNPTTSRDELYIILADYSNDLGALKKRNGKLPAEAAIERIEALIKAEKTALIEDIQGKLPEKKIHKQNTSWEAGFNEALDQVTKLIESKRSKV